MITVFLIRTASEVEAGSIGVVAAETPAMAASVVSVPEFGGIVAEWATFPAMIIQIFCLTMTQTKLSPLDKSNGFTDNSKTLIKKGSIGERQLYTQGWEKSIELGSTGINHRHI
jgi:hypothetical protein